LFLVLVAAAVAAVADPEFFKKEGAEGNVSSRRTLSQIHIINYTVFQKISLL